MPQPWQAIAQRFCSLTSLIETGLLEEDISRCLTIKKLLPRIRSLKLSTLQEKVFGYNEVTKWED